MTFHWDKGDGKPACGEAGTTTEAILRSDCEACRKAGNVDRITARQAAVSTVADALQHYFLNSEANGADVIEVAYEAVAEFEKRENKRFEAYGDKKRGKKR